MVGGTPDLQSAAIGSGAVGDFEGHLYLGTSSWLTCHVPFKKTDVLHGVAVVALAAAGQVLRRRRAGDRRRVPQLAARRVLFPDDALRLRPPPADVYAPIDALAATTPAGSQRRDLHAWLNGERTPVDDHTVRAAWTTSRSRRPAPSSCDRRSKGVAFNSRWLLGAVERVHQPPVPVAQLHRRRRGVRPLVPDPWPTCSTGRSARSSTRSARTPAARR